MKVLRFLALTLLFLAPVVASATVDVEYRLEQGECANGNRWWIVSEFVNGDLFTINGLDCNGNEYHRKGNSRIVAEDPTRGMTPTYTGVGENGEPWYAVVQFTGPELTWAGGRDANGAFWVWEEDGATAPSTGRDDGLH
ncbi:MAG: hypothetical protein JST22_12265 [Bacteroidetes bacterium]|nr:hypothetical protein [Bacteroidota bacterium]